MIADLAKKLPPSARIVIEVVVGGSAERTYTIRRDRVFPARIDRLEILAMFGSVFFKKKDVVKMLKLLDDGKLVNGMLIVLGTVVIVLWSVQRYIFRDENQQLLDLSK